MKSTLMALGIILLCGAGAAWHFYEDEIRKKFGWEKKIKPKVATVETNAPSKPRNSNSTKKETPKTDPSNSICIFGIRNPVRHQ